MIGNAADAALAATEPLEFLFSDEGNSRAVYLINGVIYKVNRGGYTCNEGEFRNATALRDVMRERNVFIPDMTMYGDVLAVEYLDGDLTGECIDRILGMRCDCNNMCLSPKMVETLNILGWDDPSYGNAMWVDGALYLIDVA